MINLKLIKSIAVIGASTDRNKFGHKIVLDLLDKGFDVFPINTKQGNIAGREILSNIVSLEKKVDLIVFVTPPPITLEVLKEAIKNGYRQYWFQPGTFNEEIAEIVSENHLEFIAEACIMKTTYK